MKNKNIERKKASVRSYLENWLDAFFLTTGMPFWLKKRNPLKKILCRNVLKSKVVPNRINLTLTCQKIWQVDTNKT